MILTEKESGILMIFHLFKGFVIFFRDNVLTNWGEKNINLRDAHFFGVNQLEQSTVGPKANIKFRDDKGLSVIQSRSLEPCTVGQIRKVLYYKNNEKLIISVRGNRFCRNILRQYKSNSIYFVVDVKNFWNTQRCHDILCSNFSSKCLSLTPELFL